MLIGKDEKSRVKQHDVREVFDWARHFIVEVVHDMERNLDEFGIVIFREVNDTGV